MKVIKIAYGGKNFDVPVEITKASVKVQITSKVRKDTGKHIDNTIAQLAAAKALNISDSQVRMTFASISSWSDEDTHLIIFVR